MKRSTHAKFGSLVLAVWSELLFCGCRPAAQETVPTVPVGKTPPMAASGAAGQDTSHTGLASSAADAMTLVQGPDSGVFGVADSAMAVDAGAQAGALDAAVSMNDSAVVHSAEAATAPAADAGPADTTDAGTADAGVASVPVDVRCQADAQMPQRTDYAKPGPHAVGTLEITFEDTSRSIAATDAHAAAPSRSLVTTIYYPAVAATSSTSMAGQAALADGGPFPMLMYSHGYSSGRSEATLVANRAASYGYVVVAPDFPLTNLFANNGAPDVNDAVNQPADVSFLIDKVLALSHDSKHLLANAIDDTRIGALGVSLGGLTTLLVSFHPKLHDLRVKVAMPIAALSSFFAEGFYHTRALPLLLVQGDLDAFVNYTLNGRRAFMRAAPNARLITVAKGSHAAFGAQFDASLLPLLNSLIAPPNADPSNPDGIGCGAVGKTLNMSGPGFVTALGGSENFIEASEAPVPCQGDEYTHPAMDPNQQEDIVVRSAVPFFEAHLAKTPETRQDACRYVLYEVPKLAGVTLE